MRFAPRCLKPGGRFVTVNCSPRRFRSGRSYRNRLPLRVEQPLRNGSPIIWSFFLENGETFNIETISRTRHLRSSFARAGFGEIVWPALRLSPEGLAAFGRKYLGGLPDRPPIASSNASSDGGAASSRTAPPAFPFSSGAARASLSAPTRCAATARRLRACLGLPKRAPSAPLRRRPCPHGLQTIAWHSLGSPLFASQSPRLSSGRDASIMAQLAPRRFRRASIGEFRIREHAAPRQEGSLPAPPGESRAPAGNDVDDELHMPAIIEFDAPCRKEHCRCGRASRRSRRCETRQPDNTWARIRRANARLMKHQRPGPR